MGDMGNFILTEFSKSVFIEKQFVDQHVQLEFTGLNQKVLIFFLHTLFFLVQHLVLMEWEGQ